MVNSLVGQAYCIVCLALRIALGVDAQVYCARITPEEIQTFTEEELKLYEFRISKRYMDRLFDK